MMEHENIKDAIANAIENGDKDELERLIHRMEILKKHKTPITLAKDGRWRTRVKLADGRCRHIYKKRRADLEDELIQIYEEQMDTVQRTFRDVFEEWYAEEKQYKALQPSSLRKYRNDYNRFFPPDDPFCRIDVMDINDSNLSVFIKKQIHDHNLTEKAFKGLKTVLRNVLAFAKRENYTRFAVKDFFGNFSLPHNMFKRQPLKDPNSEFFTDDEVAVLTDYMDSHPTLQHYGICLLLLSGLRIGELSALKWEDINLTDKTLLVSRTESEYSDDGGHRVVYVKDLTKTITSYRKVFLPEEAIPLLKRIRLLSASDEYVFTRPDGSRVESKSFRDALQRACRNASIPYRTPHKCRKTYASALNDAVSDDKFVQHQLGHKNISTTLKYYDYDRSSDPERAKLMNKANNMYK